MIHQVIFMSESIRVLTTTTFDGGFLEFISVNDAVVTSKVRPATERLETFRSHLEKRGRTSHVNIVQVSASLSDVTLLLQARCRPDCCLVVPAAHAMPLLLSIL